MALDLVDKRDLSAAGVLTAQEQHAIRAVSGWDGSEGLGELVLRVMKRARAQRLWLRCDCRSEDGRRPLVAPCRSHRDTDWWRVLAGRHVPHDPGCIFYRGHTKCRDRALWDRPLRKAPEGFFGVLRELAEEQRVSRPGRRSEEEGEQTAVRRPALLQRLLMLIERAALNPLPPVASLGDGDRWPDVLRERAVEFEIAPDRPLSELWFPHIRMWKGRLVHVRVRAAAEDWPVGHKAQAFLCWVVWDVDAHGVGTAARRDRVEVVSGVGRPVVGRNRIPPPYLFLGVVGLADEQVDYECLEGYAQPIVATKWSVPVNSRYDCRAYGTLRTTLRVLSGTFPDAEFALEKPVFDIETPDGPCLPHFLIRACRGGDELTFVVEVMGFERPEYLRGKEVTPPRMPTLGTLRTVQAGEFDRSLEGLREEGRKVTQTVREALQQQWRM